MKKKKPLKLSRLTVGKLSTKQLLEAKGGVTYLEGGGGGTSGGGTGTSCTTSIVSYTSACAYTGNCCK